MPKSDNTNAPGAQTASTVEYFNAIVFSGSKDTLIRKPDARYKTVKYADIVAMAANPGKRTKDKALAIIPSSYDAFDGRSNAAQRERGNYGMLFGDIDTGNHPLKDVIAAVSAVAGAGVESLVYSSASATEEKPKWRFFIPMAEQLPGEEYSDVQLAAFALMAEQHGIKCDEALSRTGQPVYLPNVPPINRNGADGEPLFYQHHVQTGRPMNFEASHPIHQKTVTMRREKRLAQETAVTAVARHWKENPDAALPKDHPTSWFKANHTTEQMLIEYGYQRRFVGGKLEWQSPMQQSGSYATILTTDGAKFITLSGSDIAAGLGVAAQSGVNYGDAFDLFAFFTHGNNKSAAWSDIRKNMMPRKPPERRESATDGFEVFEDIKPDDIESNDTDRRELQREENRAIGDDVPKAAPVTEDVSLATALKRFALLTDGSRVCDLSNPRIDMAFSDFANTYAASLEYTQITKEKTGKNGKVTKTEDFEAEPMSKKWLINPARITAMTKTFRPGAGKYTFDPNWMTAINTWKGISRAEKSDRFFSHIEMFLGHVSYLFGDDTERFLDWVTHIEQQPGILPHTAWLHISEKTGTGRNALASILTRLWRGHVAASLDLMGILKTGFNGALSSKLLAVVDEIREGGRDHWEHSQKLKSLVTEENRLINPKYGRQSVEFNCCRFLLLSNHRMAIPLDHNDRRFEVVICEEDPRNTAYYKELYAAINRAEFINDVAVWMRQRDIASFEPGRRAALTANKIEVASVSESEGMSYARQLVEHWPCDVVPSSFTVKLINPTYEGGTTSGAARSIMSDAGIRPYPKTIKVEGGVMRVHVLRNHAKWMNAPAGSVATELRRGHTNYLTTDPREELDRTIADKESGS